MRFTLNELATTAAMALAVIATAASPMPVTADDRGEYRRPGRDPAWQRGAYSFPGTRAGTYGQRHGHADRSGSGVATHNENQGRRHDVHRGYGYRDRGRGSGTTSYSRRSSDLQGYSRRAPPPGLNRSGPLPDNSGAGLHPRQRGHEQRGYGYRGFDRRSNGRLYGGRRAGEGRGSGFSSRD
ncbi:MAG: hypothetical protein KJO38_06275 [Gammaproteobacteria bacterium]|nr:hypothetical protein [Gammaproteobacteria bacterium]